MRHKQAKSQQPRGLGLRRTNKGIALIEALVGILIFTTGILGVVGLQAAMTRAQGSAKARADAAILSSELIGLMWADSAHTVPGDHHFMDITNRWGSSICHQYVHTVARTIAGQGHFRLTCKAALARSSKAASP
mgnify:CR=1 FL=1